MISNGRWKLPIDKLDQPSIIMICLYKEIGWWLMKRKYDSQLTKPLCGKHRAKALPLKKFRELTVRLPWQ